jgi:Caspase domain
MSEGIGRKERAIHIGINYPGTESELSGCVSDAVNLLALSIGLEITDLVLGVDIDVHNDEVMAEKTVESSREVLKNNLDAVRLFRPTKDNVLNEISDAVADDSISSLFLTYSGHGASGWESSSNTEEADGIDEFICTLGNSGEYEGSYPSFVSDDELFSSINDASQNRMNPIVITYVFDCCHSGTIFDLSHGMRKINNKVEFTTQPSHKHDVLNDMVVMSGWSGCQDVQYSYENFNAENNMVEGICTRGFLKAADDLSLFNLDNEVNHLDLTLKMGDHMFKIDSFEDADVDISNDYQVMNHSSSINIGMTDTDQIMSQKFVVGRAQNMDLGESDLQVLLEYSAYSHLALSDDHPTHIESSESESEPEEPPGPEEPEPEEPEEPEPEEPEEPEPESPEPESGSENGTISDEDSGYDDWDDDQHNSGRCKCIIL